MPDPSGAGLDDEAVTVEVEAGACLLASWGAGQELLVSSVQDPSSRAIASETKTDGADLWVLPRGTLAAAERRVVYDMAPKFAALQRVIHQDMGPGWGSNDVFSCADKLIILHLSLHLAGWETKDQQECSCTEAELTQQLVQYAAEISAILLADSPQVADVEEAGPMDSDSLSAYLELVLPQHLVWKILQIFWALPEVDRGGPVTEQLVQLVRQHAALLLPDARLASISSTIQQMAGTVAPETEPGYWSLLTQLVALGWTREAVQLLGCHSLWSQYQNASSALRQRLQPQFEMIEAVNMLLRNMPRFRLVPAAAQSEPQVGSGQLFDSLPQYQHHRRHWRGMCSDLRQGRLDGMPADCWEACAAVDADTADGLKMVASVMAGDVAAITKVLGEDARGSWLPLAVALLLHLQPDVPLMGGMLSRLIEECRAAVGSCAEAEAQQMQDTLQKLLLAGAENDARAFVLEVTRSGVCRPWTVAHVVHLLSELPASAAALAACPLPHLQCRSEEYYVLDFVSGMMAEPGMWSVALQYLAWCPVHGAAAAHHQLSRLLLAGEPALTAAVLHSCEQHSLPSVANGLRRAVGMANATEGHVAEALRWLLDAGDAAGAVRALRPLLAQTEEALLQPGEGLQLPEGLWQLEDLLQACCRDSATLTQPGCPGGDGGQPLLFLREMLALAESLDLLACGASLPAQDGARQRLRQALLRLIVHRAAPARLAGAVLLKVIPVLDGAAALLSHGEVQQMLQVVCDSGEELALSGAAAFGDGAGQDGPAAGGATAHKAALVKVALARALARTHLLAASEPGHSPVPSLAMPKQLLTNAPAPPV